jgi:hypothetical protein
MDPEQLLQSLATTLDLPGLRFDGHGCARIAIDDAPALNFERTSSAIHLYSVLAPLPPEGRESLYAQMLKGNLFGEATAGSSLAIDEPRNEILMCRTVVAEFASGPSFVSIVEQFVDTAREWQGRIAHAPASDVDSHSLAAPMMMDQFVRG